MVMMYKVVNGKGKNCEMENSQETKESEDGFQGAYGKMIYHVLNNHQLQVPKCLQCSYETCKAALRAQLYLGASPAASSFSLAANPCPFIINLGVSRLNPDVFLLSFKSLVLQKISIIWSMYSMFAAWPQLQWSYTLLPSFNCLKR